MRKLAPIILSLYIYKVTIHLYYSLYIYIIMYYIYFKSHKINYLIHPFYATISRSNSVYISSLSPDTFLTALGLWYHTAGQLPAQTLSLPYSCSNTPHQNLPVWKPFSPCLGSDRWHQAAPLHRHPSHPFGDTLPKLSHLTIETVFSPWVNTTVGSSKGTLRLWQPILGPILWTI